MFFSSSHNQMSSSSSHNQIFSSLTQKQQTNIDKNDDDENNIDEIIKDDLTTNVCYIKIESFWLFINHMKHFSTEHWWTKSSKTTIKKSARECWCERDISVIWNTTKIVVQIERRTWANHEDDENLLDRSYRERHSWRNETHDVTRETSYVFQLCDATSLRYYLHSNKTKTRIQKRERDCFVRFWRSSQDQL
jgi:hypothetical protein